MSEDGRFSIRLAQSEDYRFTVEFDQPGIPAIDMDEPPPLGTLAGPNASRLLAAAVGNCLSASLLFCLCKNEAPANAIHSESTCRLVRNAKGRLRVGGIEVTLTISPELEASARAQRCLELFEDFCVVTASIRQGVPVHVRVLNTAGDLLYEAE
jgi:organic hydroperoxide reductase OsmC/OhrA